MYDLGIKTYTPIVNSDLRSNSNCFSPSAFRHTDVTDEYICPNDERLKYASVNKSKRYRVYAISQRICKNCPLKQQCIGGNLQRRNLYIPFHQEEANVQRANYQTPRYYEVQRLRRIYCEGNFALQKDNHNLRTTKKRGNKNVTEHCLLSALALNLKRLVKYMKNTLVAFLFYREISVFKAAY